MIDHEHDDDGNCIPPHPQPSYEVLPNWRFSLWDVAAIGASVVGGIVGSIGNIGIIVHQGCNMLSREFTAAANFSRQTKELEEAQRLNEAARRQMSAGLERLVLGGEDGLQ